MKGYEEYKETEYEWLGCIPAHWGWLHLSQVSREQNIKNTGNAETNVLSLSYGRIVRKRNLSFGLVPKDYATYQIVDKGNIILRLTDLQNDKRSLRTGLVRERGIITSAYTCLKPFENEEYLQLLLHAYDTQKYFYGLGGGVRQSIGFSDIRYLMVPNPPRGEQDQIVRFLDWKLSEVNLLIRSKRKEIKALIELKRKQIKRTLAKVHTLRPLKYCVKMNDVTLSEDTAKDYMFRYVDISSVSFEEGITSYAEMTFEKAPSRARRVVCKGDIIISTVRTYLKAIAQIEDGANVVVSTGFAVLTANEYVTPSYLGYCLKNDAFCDEVSRFSTGVAYPAITPQKLGRINIPVPSIDMQKVIVSELDRKCIEIDQMVNALLKEIMLINEYRTRMISDVVTGKVDIRDIVVPILEPEADNEFADEGTESEDEVEVIEDTEVA